MELQLELDRRHQRLADEPIKDLTRTIATTAVLWLATASVVVTGSFAGEPDPTAPSVQPKPPLYREVPIPKPFLTTKAGTTFGGDLRIGDFNGEHRVRDFDHRPKVITDRLIENRSQHAAWHPSA